MKNPFLPIETEQSTETPDVGETAHHFYCRSKREDMIECRETLFELFEAFPESPRKASLAAEIIKCEDALLSPVTEVMTARVFNLLGFKVTPEPDLERQSSKPDFLVTARSGNQYLVEVFTTMRDGKGQGRSRRVLADAITLIFRKVKSRDFFVGVECIREGDSAPSAAQLATKIQAFVDAQDYDEVLALNQQGHFTTPYEDIEHNGWVVRVDVSCKMSSRGQKDSCLGSAPSMSHFGGSEEQLRDTLVKKRNQHKTHTLPFIYVGNVALWHASLSDLSQALNGTEVVRLTSSSALEHSFTEARQADGFWNGREGIRNQHVQAVLGLSRLGPDSPDEPNVRFYQAQSCCDELLEAFSAFPKELVRDGMLLTEQVKRLKDVIPGLLEFGVRQPASETR